MLRDPRISYRINVDDRLPSGWCLCFFGGRRKRNPYSGRGLDKFYSVLVELDAQRQKIVAEGNEDCNPTVWFEHSGSHNWVPVIVNLNGSNNWKKKKKKGKIVHGSTVSTESKLNLPVTVGENQSCSWRFAGELLVLILLCLALFGRTSAICCSTLWWCAVAAMRGGDCGGDGGRKMTAMKKIEYRRRTVSDKVLGRGGGSLMNRQNQNPRRGTSIG